MRQYSFLQESDNVNKILAITGMTALGDKSGSYLGDKIGRVIANTKYKKIDPDSISWSDPNFLKIVKDSLYQAKSNVKTAREWYLNCRPSDRKSARKEYLEAVNTYNEIQRDIADKNPYRWITDYKNQKIKDFSEKSKTVGKFAGMGLGGLGTALAISKK